MPYADVELLLTTWLTATLGVRTVTILPAELEKNLPVNQAVRLGGGSVVTSLDRANVSIGCFRATEAEAKTAALALRSAMEQLKGQTLTVGGVTATVANVDTSSAGPILIPWSQDVMQASGTYSLLIKSSR